VALKIQNAGVANRSFCAKSYQRRETIEIQRKIFLSVLTQPTATALAYMSDIHHLHLVETCGTLTDRDSLSLVQSGNSAPVSGIYRLKHLDSEHEVVLLRGQILPQCQCCEQPLMFTLVRSAPHVSEDEDLSPSAKPSSRAQASKEKDEGRRIG
jgi:hypothetical protein